MSFSVVFFWGFKRKKSILAIVPCSIHTKFKIISLFSFLSFRFNEAVWGTYREPVNSGYLSSDPEMQKYYQACIDRGTGEMENCVLSAGTEYISCVNDCELELCGDPETQECDDGSIACARSRKWCPTYEVVEATPGQGNATMGYIPRTYHCHTAQGVFSQQPGAILQPDGGLGNCLYEDQETLVDRSLAGDYLYCQGEVCDDVFVGGYRSRDYDPRLRPWYKATKDVQKPNWTPPYAFFTNLDLGITFNAPIYAEDEDRRKIFRGVFAVDYTFEDVNRFLVDSYGEGAATQQENYDETYVVIFEAAEPNFMVASSTGRSVASKVLEEDENVPCPDDADDTIGCVVKRISMGDLAGKQYDDILQMSYAKQSEQNFPRALVSVKLSDDTGSEAYASQSSFYSSGDDLEWVILVISPITKDTSDALDKSEGLFGVVCVIASLGFVLCLAMFVSFFLKRKSRAIILADWRFTSAFLMGCALLNISSFTFLGEATEALCMARMWTFHFLFALALSPLFVKVYRMYRLVGTDSRNPAIISNPQAVAMSMPIICIQIIILAIFTIVDPPVPRDIILVDETVVTQRVECTTDTDGFTITVLIFEFGLVLSGCALAFITRNLDSGFGQAKELGFAMYNIAFIGAIIAVITFAMDIDMTGQIVLFAMGTFCGSVFSSAAFVVPRLIQSQQETNILPAKRGVGSKTSRIGKKSSRKQSRVNFSEDVGREDDMPEQRERPVTGWSAVEEDEDAATGLKRASSVGSGEDDWTMQNGSVDPHQSIDASSRRPRRNDTTETAKEDTWNEADLEPSVSSRPTIMNSAMDGSYPSHLGDSSRLGGSGRRGADGNNFDDSFGATSSRTPVGDNRTQNGDDDTWNDGDFSLPSMPQKPARRVDSVQGAMNGSASDLLDV